MKTADIDVTYVGHYGDDLTTVNAARVSFNKESEAEYSDYEQEGWEECIHDGGANDGERYWTRLKPSDAKLITYLAKHKHFSPFNHSFISVRVKAPIFCARQMVKHKFMPWNEVSRRYVDDEPEFYLPEIWRSKAESVKQGSSPEEVSTKFSSNVIRFDDECSPYVEQIKGLHEITEDTINTSLLLYTGMIKGGVCAEQARMVLPQSMMTEWMWSGTLGAFCDMLRLRLDPHTQYESRIVANKILEIVSPLFPVSVAALLELEAK